MMTDPRVELIKAANHFYGQGWMVGTAGNLSARCWDGSFWITASGKAKGQLDERDFLRLSVTGEVLEKPESGLKSSAETSIHQAIYDCFPEAQACYHVHSVEANLVSRFTTEDQVLLPPLEMLKGFGLWLEEPICWLPVFANHLQVPKIAEEMRDRFQETPPGISACLIRDHGVTVWGNSPQIAFHRVELAEYIFRYMVAARGVSLS
jgi:methylthioribulose-1-phosphate dehydratase